MTVVDCKAPMKVRLDRINAGFHVEVGEIPATGEWILQGTTSTYRARVPILPEQRIEAYLHPCVFLPHPDRFFRELKEDEASDETALPKPGGNTLTLPHDASDPQDYCEACDRSLLAHEAGPYCDNCSDDAS